MTDKGFADAHTAHPADDTAGDTGAAMPQAHHFPPGVLTPLPQVTDALVKLVDAQRSFDVGGAVVPALRKVNVAFPTGCLSALIGPPASGKSTLLATVAGQETLSSGHLYVDSRPMNALSRQEIDNLRGRSIGYVSRSDHLIPSLDVTANITLRADMHDATYDPQRLDGLMRAFDLHSIADQLPADLSLQQRFDVSLVRELLLDPPLLLIDDLGHDPASPHVQRLIRYLHRDNDRTSRTTIICTQHAAIAAQCDRVFFMAEGRVVAHMHSPTSSAVSDAVRHLDDWNPAKAFRPVKNLLSASQLYDIYGEATPPVEPQPEPPEQVWDEESSASGASLWPAMPENLRERLQQLRQDGKLDQPEPSHNVTAADLADQEPPPGLGHLTGKPQKSASPVDLKALEKLLGAPSSAPATPTQAVPSRFIPLDEDVATPKDTAAPDKADTAAPGTKAEVAHEDDAAAIHDATVTQDAAAHDAAAGDATPTTQATPTPDPALDAKPFRFADATATHADASDTDTAYVNTTHTGAPDTAQADTSLTTGANATPTPATGPTSTASDTPIEPTDKDTPLNLEGLDQPEQESMADINQHIVRMKARLRTMAEQAERRLSSMEKYSEPLPETTPPKPVKREHHGSQRISSFRETDEERWKHLMSTFAPKETEDAPPATPDTDDTTTEKSATPEQSKAQRQLELVKMMQRAQELLNESHDELQEVRDELNEHNQR